MEAETPQAVVERLQETGYFPIAVEPAPLARVRAWRRPGGGRVRAGQLASLIRRLSDLLQSGLPLARTLDLLARDERHPALRRVLGAVQEEVRGGAALSAAAARHPAVFPPMLVGMLKAGEISGGLDTVTQRLADYFERTAEVRGRVQAALIYPAVLLCVGSGAVAFLLTGVIPKFAALFDELGQALPLPTRMLLAASGFLNQTWWALLAVGIVALLGFDRWRRTGRGRLAFAGWLLRAPGLGALLQAEYAGRFARTLGTLLQSGTPMLQALELAAGAVPNVVVQREVEQVARAVEDGAGLARPLKASAVFPALLGELATVGEEAGNLDAALLRGAGALEKDVERRVGILLSLLEPAIVILLGGAVAFIVLAVMLPVTQMSVVLR